jgi:hypothetical protein
MIPKYAVEAFAQDVAKDLHKRTGRMVGFAVSLSAFQAIFAFKVGTFEVKKIRVPTSALRNSESWPIVAADLLAKVLAETQLDQAPTVVLDEHGRRHITMKAETGFITAQQVRAIN